MKRILQHLLFITLISVISLHAFAQIPQKSGIPNCDARNNDFQDRRQTPNFVNFGKEYYKAHQQLPLPAQSLKKAKDEWTPRGPFGKTRLAGTGRVNSMQFHPTDTNTWFICVAQGGLWKTTDAGKSWNSVSGDLPIIRTSSLAIHPTNPNIMYVALGDYAYLGHNLQANDNKRNSHYGLGIYKTTDGGEHWVPTGLSFAQTEFEGSLIARVHLHPNNPNKVIAVGQTGCYVSTDGGDNWTKTYSGLFRDLEQDPSNADVLFATTGYVHAYKYGEVSILKSTDFGATWQKASTPMPKTGAVQRVEIAVAPSDPSIIYAIASDIQSGFYGFYKSTDAGKTYVEQINSITYPYNLLNGSLDDEPGGQGWYDLAICVDKKDKNKVLVGGINMWQTTDGGKNFKPVTYWLLNYYNKSLHADIHQIIQHPTNNSYFACHDGGISRTFNIIPDNISTMKDDRNASTVWENYTNGLNISSFYRLSLGQNDSKEVIAGAQDNSTVYSDGTVFFNLSGGDGMESVIDDGTQYRYTSSQNGNITAYVYQDFFNYEGQLFIPNGEVGEWTTPMSSANDNLYVLYGNLYTAYGSDIVQKISDFDKMPSRTYSKPGTALAVEKSNGQRIYLGKRGYLLSGLTNEMWTSPDGGKSWTQMTDILPDSLYPSYLEMNQKNPNQAWATFAGFDSLRKVYQTDDGGKTWKNITYNLPNISVNCVVHQPDLSGMVYVGTDLGVYYLQKDSTHWKYYSDGLPKVIVSELEIDMKTKTMVAATFGRGLWEVGLTNVVIDSSVGINPVSKNISNLMISGNPVTNTLNFTVELKQPSPFSIKVVDVTGKAIFEEDVAVGSNALNRTYDLSQYNSGMYFIVVQMDGERVVRKFVKK